MEKPFSEQLYQIADSMGISLYQRFSVAEGAVFLRCNIEELKRLQKQGNINSIQVIKDQIDFFGYQLLEYLLGCVTGGVLPAPKLPVSERIIRTKEVQEITGLSRTSLWRLERSGDFPARVALCAGSIGWLFSDVERWIRTRKQA